MTRALLRSGRVYRLSRQKRLNPLKKLQLLWRRSRAAMTG